jgi:hypothetical protein
MLNALKGAKLRMDPELGLAVVSVCSVLFLTCLTPSFLSSRVEPGADHLAAFGCPCLVG